MDRAPFQETVVELSGQPVAVRFVRNRRARQLILRIDNSVGREQRERLEQVKARRDSIRLEQTLTNLVAGARGQENTMALVLDAVRAYATVGEICGALKPVFGEYREVAVF